MSARLLALLAIAGALAGCAQEGEAWIVRVETDLPLDGPRADEPGAPLAWRLGNETWRARELALQSVDPPVTLRIEASDGGAQIRAFSGGDCLLAPPVPTARPSGVFAEWLDRGERVVIELRGECVGEIVVLG